MGLVIYRAWYNKKTFEKVKQYVFTAYPTQPLTMIIESDYCFVSADDGKRNTTTYHIMEITKKENTNKIRLLENDHSIGFWETIISMGLQGLEYNSLVLGTKKNLYKIERSDMMPPGTQAIRFLDFPEIPTKTA